MKKCTKLMAASLAIIMICFLLLAGMNSGWGSVKVSNVYFPDQQGNLLHGVLYKPKNVNFSNPVPAVISVHGGNGYMGMMSNVTLELARRGYVVLAIDCNGSGWSDYTETDVSTNMVDANGNPLKGLENDNGVGRALAYIKNCDFVDGNNIVLIGHSAGGTACFNAAFAHQEDVKGAMVIASGGFAMRLSTLNPEDLHFNMSYIVSAYDEWITAIMGTKSAEELLAKDFLINAVGSDGPVEANKVYGSFEENNARVIYTTEASHSGNLISKDAIAKMLAFTDNSVGQVNDLSYTDQIFWFKELVSVIGVIGFGLFLVAMAFCLCETKFFAPLVAQKNRPGVAVSKSGRAVMLVIAAVLPLTIYYEIGLKSKASDLLPFRWANAYALWAASSGLLILVAFVIWHFVTGKKNGGNILSYGLSTSTTEVKWDGLHVLKALCFAIIVAAAGYTMIYLLYTVFPVEFGYWFFGIKPVPVHRLRYIPIYFAIFVVSTTVMTMVNATFAYSTVGESKLNVLKQYLIPLAVSIGGVAVVMLVFYTTLRSNGYTTLLPRNALDSVTLGSTYPVIPNYMVASLTNTAIYRKTKNTYVAIFLTAIILAILTVCPNSFSI